MARTMPVLLGQPLLTTPMRLFSYANVAFTVLANVASYAATGTDSANVFSYEP